MKIRIKRKLLMIPEVRILSFLKIIHITKLITVKLPEKQTEYK